MSPSRHDDSGESEARGDTLWLLGQFAWRLVQAALVVAAVVLMFTLLGPHGGDTKEKAYIAAMKSDLRNLVTAQEAYAYDHQTYAPSLEALGSTYSTSTGVTLVIDRGTVDAFAATTTHGGTSYRCGIFLAHAPSKLTLVLSWVTDGERHDLFLSDDKTWIERWPGHEDTFQVVGRDVAYASSGTLLRKDSYRSLELFVRDRGQPLRSVLWRVDRGEWKALDDVTAGSESAPLTAARDTAPPAMAPPWPGAREGEPRCWKG